MGHLINPTALRLGWFTNWCDSWFSDFVYYPEFLHDVFRIRLYLNFIFYRGFFMKKGLLFSHFELFFKYNYLFVRFYYYDGALMAGLYAFDGEFMNRFFRKSFYYLRRRQLLYEKNRYVTLFLGLFFSLFSFTDFFQKAYLDSITFDEHSYLKKFCYELPKGGFISSSKLDVLRKRLFSKKRKIKKIKVAKARGSLFFKRSPFRFQSGDSFLTYNKAFP